MKTTLTSIFAFGLLAAAPSLACAVTLNDLNFLATGNYSFTADSETFQGFVDHDGTNGWLLVGRGREGWEFDEDGQGLVADVNQNLGTTAGFAPAAYRTAIINGLTSQVGIDLLDVEIRIRRAATTTGSSYQEARWRPDTQSSWTWDFDAGSGYDVDLDIFASTLGAAFSDTDSNTRDGNAAPGTAGNNYQRIFTWPWGSHNNQQGFAYGSSVSGVNGDDPNTFLWEFTTENHAIPYAEIFIRRISEPPLIPEPSTGALLGLALVGIAARSRRSLARKRG